MRGFGLVASCVALAVGCGEEPTRVPNVVGQPADQAAAKVGAADLTVAFRPQGRCGPLHENRVERLKAVNEVSLNLTRLSARKRSPYSADT